MKELVEKILENVHGFFKLLSGSAAAYSAPGGLGESLR